MDQDPHKKEEQSTGNNPENQLASELVGHQGQITRQRQQKIGSKVNRTEVEDGKQRPEWRDQLAGLKEQMRPKLEETDPDLHRRMQMRLEDQANGRPYRTAHELSLAIEKEKREAERRAANASSNGGHGGLPPRRMNQSPNGPSGSIGRNGDSTTGYMGQSNPPEYYEDRYSDLAEEFDDKPSYERVHQNRSNPQEFARRERDRANLNYANKEAARDTRAERLRQDSFGNSLRKPGLISSHGVERWEARWQNRQDAAAQRAEQSEASHADRAPESVYDRSDHTFNYYENQFEQHRDRIVSRSLSRGVVDVLERGNFEFSTATILRNGFWETESRGFDKRIDPQGILSNSVSSVEDEDSFDAKRSELASEKVRLETRIKRKILNKYAETVSDEELRDAEYRGSLFAINTGARKDVETGEIIFSISADKGAETRDFMEKAGIDFAEDTEAAMASYQGFANIIEAIKDKDELTEKGFATLDWYFDNFNYQEHMGEFLGKMDIAQELADEAWVKKYEEYMERRDERERYLKQQSEKPLPIIESAEEVTEDVFFEETANVLGVDKKDVEDVFMAPVVLEAFPDAEVLPVNNPGTGRQSGNHSKGPSSRARVTECLKNFFETKNNVDPNPTIIRLRFKDSHGRELPPYWGFQYKYNNSYVAVIVPFSTGNNAGYVWVGNQEHTTPTDWMDAFVQNPNPGMKSSKYQARQRTDVSVFYHVAAMKQGRNAVQNIWFNMNRHIERVV